MKICRYLTDEKFDWLLSDNGLYLSAAADQSDPSEGVYDHTFLSRFVADNLGDVDSAMLRDLDKLQLGLQNHGRTDNFLSCWYLGAEESQEMWEEFGTNGVIVFSSKFLMRSALPRPLEHATSFYDVKYNDEMKRYAVNEPLRVKNEKFHRQREFRIVFDLTGYSVLTGFEARAQVFIGGEPSYLNSDLTACISSDAMAQSHQVIRKKGNGFVVNYNLSSIIEEVRIHPQASDSDLYKTKNRLQALGVYCTVRHSSLRGAYS